MSQSSWSNFHQNVRTWLIALASHNGAAHWKWSESSDDCVKGQYIPYPFFEPVERAEFHDIHTDVDSVVSKNLAECTLAEKSQRNSSYRLKVNEFMHLTAQHSIELMNVWSDLKHMRTREYVGEPLLDAEDQTTKGAVTPVKKQEQSGLCWAFLTTSSWSAAQGYRTAAVPPELPRWTCPRDRQSM